MYQCSHHVIRTQIQHCDTHSAVFAHVASRMTTTNYHRPMLAARASVKTSKNRPLRGETAHSPARFGSGVSLQLQNLTTNPSLVNTRILRRPGRMAGWLLSWVCVPPARTVPATCNTPHPSSRRCGFLHLLSALLLGTGNDTHQSLHTLDPSDEPHLSPM